METISLDAEAHSLAEAHEVPQRAKPAGFELTSAAVKMSNGTTLLAATGMFARRDGAREIEAADMSGLSAAVPRAGFSCTFGPCDYLRLLVEGPVCLTSSGHVHSTTSFIVSSGK